MKLKHLFFNALAVMTFAACSSEAEEIKPADKSETSISLNLELQGNMNTPEEDGLRAMTLDKSEDYPPFTYEEGVSSFVTHCFLRNEEGTAQFYAEVDWDATVETSGRITLKMKGSTLNLLPTGDLIGKSEAELQALAPKAGEIWYIAGMMGGGVLSADRTKVDFTYTEDEATFQSNQVRIPLSFSWKPFTISKAFGERAPQIVVQFKPKGSLIHARYKMKSGTVLPNPKPMVTIALTSNAFDRNVAFDYTLSTPSQLVEEPTSAYTSKWTGDFAFRTTYRAIEPDDNLKGSVLFWGIYRTDIAASEHKTEIYLASHTGRVLGSGKTSEVITTPFEEGLAYTHFFEVERPLMPLEAMAKANISEASLAADAPAFLTSETSTEGSAYLNFDDAVARFSTRVVHIDGRRYQLLGTPFWSVILPNANVLLNATPGTTETRDDTGSQHYGPRLTNIQLYGAMQSVYHTKSATLGYAIRLIGESSSNYFRTAYRYELVKGTSGHEHLKMTSRYLGASFTGSITDVIEDATFWNVNNSDDVVRYIPLAGQKSATDVTGYLGQRAYLWTASAHSTQQTLAYSVAVLDPILRVYPSQRTLKFPIRLMQR